jgi:dTDP-glucose 4,6-dehydratase
MKVIITGGSGFIGSAAISYFLKKYKKWQILNIDNLSYSAISGANSESEKSKRYSFENVDIREYDALSRVITKFRPDIIINFAAESHVDRSLNSSHVKEFLSTNVEGVINLLNIVNENKIEKFIQISTDEVGGDFQNGGSFFEDDILKPRNFYAASKASAEMVCISYYESYGTPILRSRCSNNIGFYQFEEKFIPRTVYRLMQGLPIELNLEGKPIRSWISTTNHIRAIDCIIHNGKFGEVYHIPNGYELSNLELAKIILKILNLPEKNNIISKNLRPTDDMRYSLGSKKIHNIGYEHVEDFDSFFEKVILWYKNYYTQMVDING